MLYLPSQEAEIPSGCFRFSFNLSADMFFSANLITVSLLLFEIKFWSPASEPGLTPILNIISLNTVTPIGEFKSAWDNATFNVDCGRPPVGRVRYSFVTFELLKSHTGQLRIQEPLIIRCSFLIIFNLPLHIGFEILC